VLKDEIFFFCFVSFFCCLEGDEIDPELNPVAAAALRPAPAPASASAASAAVVVSSSEPVWSVAQAHVTAVTCVTALSAVEGGGAQHAPQNGRFVATGSRDSLIKVSAAAESRPN
jgi:hypothetical protein